MEDVLAPGGDERRGLAAIFSGELLLSCDPEVSEWDNLPWVMPRYPDLNP